MVFYTRKPALRAGLMTGLLNRQLRSVRQKAKMAKITMGRRQLRSTGMLAALFAVLCVFSAAVQAVPVKGLYTARAEVTDQSRDSRLAVYPEMLQTVVGRLLGEPDPQQLLQRWPSLRSELKSADRYISQFLYQRLGAEQLLLRAEFEPSALDKLIRRLQLPQWGADRPEVLVVIAWQDGSRRAVLASSPDSQTASELAAELSSVASDAGLPIALPLMDLEDERAMPEQALRAGFSQGLMDVAARYGADAVLLGRIKLSGGAALGAPFAQRSADVRWSLYQQDETTRHANDANTIRSGMQTGLWMATRTLAAKYAVQGGDHATMVGNGLADNVLVNVLAVNDLVDLKRVENHLRQRTVISAARLLQTRELNGERMAVFELKLQGNVGKLEQALAVGRLLRPTTAPAVAPVSVAEPEGWVGEDAQPAVNLSDSSALQLWYRLP